MVDIAITLEEVSALAPEYERLCLAIGNESPFALRDWHEIWCRHFLRSDSRHTDQALFHVLRDPSGVCVGIVPLIWTQRRVGPIKVGFIELLGADPVLTELRSPLILPGFERAAVRAVHQRLGRLRNWHWINWAGVDKPLSDAIDSEVRATWYAATTDYVIDLPDSWEKLRAGLRRNIRESLRHCYNSLKRDGIAFRLQVAHEPGGMRSAVDRFLELHKLRANMAGGVPHPNRFESQVARDFLHSVCERLAHANAVRVFQLEIGDRIVASRIGFVVGGSLYLYYSGFDPEWARYSVMTTTMAEAIKYAIALGLRSVNLSPGTDVGKTRWGPREVPFRSGFVQREGLLSGIVCKTYFKGRFGDSALARLLHNPPPARRDLS